MCATFTPPAADRHRKRRGYYSTWQSVRGR